jgi:hypothetical protein
MVLSDRWWSESVGFEEVPVSAPWFEATALGRVAEGIVSIEEARLGLKAA